jgi:hypothetical protein
MSPRSLSALGHRRRSTATALKKILHKKYAEFEHGGSTPHPTFARNASGTVRIVPTHRAGARSPTSFAPVL